jgi:polyhydroxybutyrate depolymerase
VLGLRPYEPLFLAPAWPIVVTVGNALSFREGKLVLKFKCALFVLLLTSVGFGQTQPGFTVYTTTWANNTRTYGVYIPQEKGMPANPPMLFYLHGTFAGSALPWNGVTQWIGMANQYKFIAVWPLSTYVPRIDSSYWAANDVAFTFPSDPDDTGWLCSLIPQLVNQFKADPNAVFLTGMSSGGMMTQRVGMTCPQYLAAIAPVSGQIYMEQMTDSWQPPATINTPLSVLEIHGDADTDLNYCGQTPHLQWGASFMILPSVDQDMAFWAKVNGLLPPSQFLCTSGSPTPGVTGYTIPGNGVTLEFIDNVGGGHVWPTWAYQTVWEFFVANERH